jgi:hypothetical protein
MMSSIVSQHESQRFDEVVQARGEGGTGPAGGATTRSRRWPAPPSPLIPGTRHAGDVRLAVRLMVAVVALLGAFAGGAFAAQSGMFPADGLPPSAGGPAASAPPPASSAVPLETPPPRPAPETNPRGLASCSGIARLVDSRQPIAVAKDPCPRWLKASILRLAMGGR